MPRSPLQPGPEQNHYHNTLGVDEQVPTGTTPTLAEVLAVGNDAAGLNIVHEPVSGDANLVISVKSPADAFATPTIQAISQGAGNATLNLSAAHVSGGSASIDLYADVVAGAIALHDGTSYGSAGMFLASADGVVWRAPLVRVAAGVPSGAPGVAELPIAFDSTAVTGGAYVWDSAAWVQVSVIP